jgi:AraC-like DNA-binding protein
MLPTLEVLPFRLTADGPGRKPAAPLAQRVTVTAVDVLADVLRATKRGGATITLTETRGPWGLRAREAQGAVVHAVNEGACWLHLPGSAPIRLRAPEVVLLPAGGDHALSSDPSGRLDTSTGVLPSDPSDPPGGPERPATPDGIGPAAPTTVVVSGAYMYDGSAAHPLLATLPTVLRLPAGPDGGGDQVGDTVRALRRELADGAPGASLIADRLVDVLVVQVLRAWAEARGDDGGSWLLARRDPEVAAALAAIHEDTARQWTVESLARHVGVSRATLARRFAALVGQPPMAYVARWRVQFAGRLLRDTNDPVGAVARRVGYRSEFAFSRAFSRAHGVPPHRYRSTVRRQLAADGGVVRWCRRAGDASWRCLGT